MARLLIPVALGTSRAGLAHEAQLYTPGGQLVGDRLPLLEEGGGSFTLDVTVADDFEGRVRVFAEDDEEVLAATTITPEPAGSDPLAGDVSDYEPGTAGAALANLGHLAGGPVVVVAPHTRDGRLNVIAGDSYLIEDGRQIDVPQVPGDSWPADLTGWTVEFVSGTVERPATVAAGPPRTVRVELTGEESAALVDRARWAIVAEDSDDHRVTLRRGTVVLAPAVP